METDVLVIGGGGAGLRAAIEARTLSASVVLVSKSAVPSGCTPLAMGLTQAACVREDSPDVHFKDTVSGGRLLSNRRLVRILVDEALEQVMQLRKFGTEVVLENDKMKVLPYGGCTHPRCVVTEEPYTGGFVKGLVQEAKRVGVRFLDRTAITSLLKSGHSVVGATGLDLRTGELMAMQARATILASGGGGQVFPLTTNPPESTGDGYALAYRASATLQDMEFIQFRASIVHPSSMRGQPPPGDGLVTLGGRFYNAQGERYMKRHDSEKAERVTRDLIAIHAYKEIKEGKGTANGGVYSDLSGVPDQELKRYQGFLNLCKSAGIDPSWKALEWAPGAHFFMGGVRINERCETTLPGLYAAGEVTGGLHGANRLGGNALTEVLVFGARAGRFAAEYARSIKDVPVDNEQLQRERDRVTSILQRKQGNDSARIRRRIQDTMWNSAGVIRRHDELSQAVRSLEELRRNGLAEICVTSEGNYDSLARALETQNMVEVGEMIIRSALERTESRGSHLREDYPNSDDEWLKSVCISQEDGNMKIWTEKIDLDDTAI